MYTRLLFPSLMEQEQPSTLLRPSIARHADPNSARSAEL